MSKKDQIRKALIESGHREESIQFGRVFGGMNRPYLRYSYWKPINLTPEEMGLLGLTEYADWDEDCGYKYSYEFDED